MCHRSPRSMLLSTLKEEIRKHPRLAVGGFAAVIIMMICLALILPWHAAPYTNSTSAPWTNSTCAPCTNNTPSAPPCEESVAVLITSTEGPPPPAGSTSGQADVPTTSPPLTAKERKQQQKSLLDSLPPCKPGLSIVRVREELESTDFLMDMTLKTPELALDRCRSDAPCSRERRCLPSSASNVSQIVEYYTPRGTLAEAERQFSVHLACVCQWPDSFARSP